MRHDVPQKGHAPQPQALEDEHQRLGHGGVVRREGPVPQHAHERVDGHARVVVLARGGRRRARRAVLGRKRVIQVRFNLSVPRARVPEKASMLRDRSER